jgi:hypothetical protein
MRWQAFSRTTISGWVSSWPSSSMLHGPHLYMLSFPDSPGITRGILWKNDARGAKGDLIEHLWCLKGIQSICQAGRPELGMTNLQSNRPRIGIRP